MTDLWIDVLLSILVTAVTVIADWLAHLLVAATRGLAIIKRVIDQSISDTDKLIEIRKEVEKFFGEQSASLIWGSDLAGIAFSLDLAILGVWVTNPSFFPFFSRFNSLGASRELPVWVILLAIHFVLLLVSIALKHLHTSTVESSPAYRTTKFPRREWFALNKYVFAGNILGFLSLLGSFVVITNAI